MKGTNSQKETDKRRNRLNRPIISRKNKFANLKLATKKNPPPDEFIVNPTEY